MPTGDADRIRQHVLDTYIARARAQGKSYVEVRARDVNIDLNLKKHYRNIRQTLEGEKFQNLAQVSPPKQIGPRESASTVFRFRL
ncbi:MAG: hypothetical protein GDA52_09850 [Rhodobacteraceae bacterium]|nr:hypothetical protein [Paracoccaceae bacterium]